MLALSIVLLALPAAAAEEGPVRPVITEPCPWLSGANASGAPAVVASPDPNVGMTWGAATNATRVQVYNATHFERWTSAPAGAFTVSRGAATSGVTVAVHGIGSVMIDFGAEHAGWVEFASADPAVAEVAAAGRLRASISEYNEPYDGKTKPVVAYAGGVFRLEPNPELYEGVRFVWIFVDPNPASTKGTFEPFTLTDLRLVSRVKPVNYAGQFASSDPVLTSAWYTGAYGSRLNMEDNAFNSILMERGDRVSIQGDGHPAMAAALVAFGGDETYRLVKTMLNQTDSGSVHGHKVVDQSIMPYPIFWGMSVNDYYWATGDTAGFLALAPDVGSIIDKAVTSFLQDGLDIGWFGWDDRVGNGFCGSCNQEAQLAFAALVIRACHDFSASLRHAGDTANATRYNATASDLTGRLRARPAAAGTKFYDDYGIHAGAMLINARVTTPDESLALFHRTFSNPATMCSWSNFNQYWNLQAAGNVGLRDHAAAIVRLCWGPQTVSWDGDGSRWGKGCFWEVSSPEWTRFLGEGDLAPGRPSYCHPWASGVTHWLSSSYAGIVPLAPGYKAFAVIPHLSSRDWRVAASLQGAEGAIELTALREEAPSVHRVRVRVSVSAPQGTAGLIGLRLEEEISGCGLDTGSLVLNGEALAAERLLRYDENHMGHIHPGLGERFLFAATHSDVVETIAIADYVCDPGVLGATAKESPRCTGLGHCPPFAPAHYPATSSVMRHSGGDWKGAFGSDGYMLFGFDDNGTDVAVLPRYVVNIGRGVRSISSFVGRDANNASFLEDPRHPGERALGVITNGGERRWLGHRGTHLDINVTAAAGTYNVTLYSVANVKPVGATTWSGTRQAVRVLDLKTMAVIAVEQRLDITEQGTYWTLTCNRSVRLRVMPLDGDPGFSAVFFDSLEKQ